MKTITTMFTTLLLTATFMSTPARATSNNYVVLESITAVNTTVLLGGNLEYELVVSSPSSFTWDPKGSNWDGFLRIVLCRTEMVEINSNPINCQFQNLQGRYLLTQIELGSSDLILQRNYYTFTVFGKPINYEIGEYFVYMVRLPNANQNDTDETHSYLINREKATDIFGSSVNISVPSFLDTYVSIVELIVEEEIVIPNTPTPPATIQRPAASTVQSAPVVAPAIQSNFFLPAIKGDQYWRPLREVKGNFENWRVGKRNSLDGVSNRFTKTNGSLMTFTTTGDAVSVRYLAGKKRGGFSIYVNGQFLDRVDANQKRKKTLVKTWDGLGDGRHYIDIVAELSNDQSLAINGVQKLKK